MSNYEYNRRACQATFQLKSIGTKHELISNKVIKWTYRQGIGSYPKAGQSVFCFVGCSLADGSDVIVSRETNISKFLIGRDQLIKGLQLALTHSKKQQVFKLFVSSQFAYEDNKDIKMIPPHSSLIFQITILQIAEIPLHKKCQSQAFYQIYHFFQLTQNQMYKANPLLSKQQIQKHYDQAIQYLNLAYELAQKIKYHRGNMRIKVIIKMIYFYIKINNIEQALKLLQIHEKLFLSAPVSIQESKYLYIKTKIKLLRFQNKLKELKFMQKCQQFYHQSVKEIEVYEMRQKQYQKESEGHLSYEQNKIEIQQNMKFVYKTKSLLYDYFSQIDQIKRIKKTSKKK